MDMPARLKRIRVFRRKRLSVVNGKGSRLQQSEELIELCGEHGELDDLAELANQSAILKEPEEGSSSSLYKLWRRIWDLLVALFTS